MVQKVFIAFHHYKSFVSYITEMEDEAAALVKDSKSTIQLFWN